MLLSAIFPTMQCDNPSTVIHTRLCFLAKNHERKKKRKKGKKIKPPCEGDIQRFMINREPGTCVPHSINTMKTVPSEVTLAGEFLLTLARATQSKLEIKKNTKNSTVVQQVARAIKVEFKNIITFLKHLKRPSVIQRKLLLEMLSRLLQYFIK